MSEPDAVRLTEAQEREAATVGLLCLLLLLPTEVWAGFVLSRMWGWFVVPLGVPAIGILQAAGLLLMIGMVRLSSRKADPVDWAWFARWLRITTAGPLLVLGIGWLLQWLGGAR